MRTIKFRAWDKENKKLYSCNILQFAIGGIRFTDILNDKQYIIELVNGSYELMQFTGLFDKNGKEIYEGDIVKNSNRTLLTLDEDPRTYLVIWKEGQYDAENKWLRQRPGFEFIKIQPKNKRYMELIFNQSQIEVIGNICENPELLNPEEGEKK